MSSAPFLLPLGKDFLLFDPLRDLSARLSADDCARLRGAKAPTAAIDGLLRRLSLPVDEPSERRGSPSPAFIGLITTRACNMACGYCDFTTDERDRAQECALDPQRAFAGISWMAGIAGRQGRDVLPVHFFGGEPFVAWEFVRMAVEYSRTEARRHGLRAWFEASTNGLYSARKAAWIGANLHRVVLSLDGPAQIQDRNRPARSGAASSTRVEASAHIIGAETAELYLRTCVTADRVDDLVASVDYFLDHFRPTAIAIEPVHGRPGATPTQPDPGRFVRGFAQACAHCRERGVDLLFSAAQPGNTGVSLCPVGNDGLIVHPDGRIAACYLPDRQWRRRGLDLYWGDISGDGGPPVIDDQALTGVRALNVTRYPRCRTCFCRWHCAGACHVNHSYPGNREQRDGLCTITRALSYWSLLDGCCRARHLPLQVDFHGDNEPLLHLDLLRETVDRLNRVADRVGVGLRIGCTTGGLISEQSARWALHNCDRLTLSHDGPLAQDRLRPTRSGKPSRRQVERSLDILANGERRGELLLRATLTSLQQDQQAGMVDYFLDQFAVDGLVFHPVYASPYWRRERGLGVDARRFVRGFVAARRLARARGSRLDYAGSRAPERHGRHCSLLQRNLLLTADGDASLCFLALDARHSWDRRRLYGHPGDPGGGPAMAMPRLQQLAHSDPRCRTCFNLWHCEQGCPSHCPLDPDPGSDPGKAFDCRIPFWIGLVDLLESAGFELHGDDFERLFERRPVALESRR